MKFTLGLIFAFFISSSLGLYTHGHDGQPKCTHPVELERPWRNNFDPRLFWICASYGNPISAECAFGQGFLDTSSELGCVAWEQWYWVTPYDPPSLK